MLIKELQELGFEQLKSKHEADILLYYCLGKTRSYLYAHSDTSVSKTKQDQFFELLKRRLNGEPIAYLTEEKEFWSLPLKITKDVLIPRPETELLVEKVLEALKKKETSNPSETITVLDLGTGSGAIAISIAKECPHSQVVAVDRLKPALDLAKYNATSFHLNNICFYLGSWFSAIKGEQTFDVIVSNPPYIAIHDPHLSEGDLRFEPKEALIAGEDGLNDLRHIIAHADRYLKPKGYLILEHGYNQGIPVAAFMIEQGFSQVQTFKDLSGLDRVTQGLRL